MSLEHGEQRTAPVFPRLRWVLLAWLAVWVPTYVWSSGWANFLQLCDVGVFLTCLGIWRGSALLLSSQAVGTLIVSGIWMLDVGARLVSGHHLIGGTEYMWNSASPLFVRLLSLFHVASVPLLLWSLRRTGYDRRGLGLMAAIAAVALVAARLVSNPVGNMNFAFRDPFFHRPWDPAPLHLLLSFLVLSLGAFVPTHLVLARALPRAEVADVRRGTRSTPRPAT